MVLMMVMIMMIHQCLGSTADYDDGWPPYERSAPPIVTETIIQRKAPKDGGDIQIGDSKFRF